MTLNESSKVAFCYPGNDGPTKRLSSGPSCMSSFMATACMLIVPTVFLYRNELACFILKPTTPPAVLFSSVSVFLWWEMDDILGTVFSSSDNPHKP